MFPAAGRSMASGHVNRAGIRVAGDFAMQDRLSPSGVEKKSFPSSCRLLSGPQYARVMDARNRVSDRYFILNYLANASGRARLGLAISKKAVKTSVARNRIKRIARESFRLHQHALPALDIVVLCRATVLEAENADLFEALRKLLKRLPAC